MEVLRGFFDIELEVDGSVVSIGNFDGVHRGHQAVIRSAVEAAREAELISVVCTFDPHTRVFLSPDRPPRLLETLEQRIAAIRRLGVDVLVIIPFVREVAQQPREEFVEQFLRDALHAEQVHVSKDFTFGRGGRGNVGYLRDVARQHGFEVHVVPAVMANGGPVSSTRIRDALAAGEVGEAAELLGRPFAVTGRVVHGEGRGRDLDAPTANIEVGDRFIPANGVYITEARIEGVAHPSVTNVGVRPTFDRDGPITVETHLLDGTRDLYDKELSLAFLKRLRGERRFDSAEALVEQIGKDVEAATRFFAAERGSRG